VPWKDYVIRSKADSNRALALLEGFDLMVLNFKENEYLVPGLLEQSRHQISGDAFKVEETLFYLKHSYTTALLPGAFAAIVVWIARLISYKKFSPIAVVFYKLVHMGQLFCSSASSTRNFNYGLVLVYLTLTYSEVFLESPVETRMYRS
jgi:hypothetical protein